jgi:hypothetical protein
MLKWMLCIFVTFDKDVYSISWSQFEIWIIRLFTMLIVMFFWSLRCNFTNNIDKKSYVKIQNLINCQIQHTLDLSKLQRKLQKNMTINMVNNLIIHISNWLHEME